MPGWVLARQGCAGSHRKVVWSSKGDGEGRAGLAAALGFTRQGVRQMCRGRGEVGQGRRAEAVSRGGLDLAIYSVQRPGRGEHVTVACSARRPERSLDAQRAKMGLSRSAH
jgi:hypothetical protein